MLNAERESIAYSAQSIMPKTKHNQRFALGIERLAFLIDYGNMPSCSYAAPTLSIAQT
ncbi:hypothetical protein SAMN04488505_107199 [Chitinophaga rupis]|uniref:Uncharacterized protein n=1 Tax=Chitinophaga rupis TaxID=573321 RepID=A0A1H8CQZ9_9BACT|nr:hypothetical protein SAMN04488505_107199 [Chitinophaga rupis]